jgi:phosphoglycerate dehydrogenase-like enzyme
VSTGRPPVALAMHHGLERAALRPAHLERLATTADLLDPVSITGLDPDRATEVLARAEVLLGHWGCPPLDEALLDRAPRLRMLAYAAGTVKDVVTPATFERGVLVTSGAAANAVPVAEYTVAVILLANKDAFAAAHRLRGAGAPPPGPRRHPVGNWAKRIGIVGASHVGRATIERLAPYELDVVVADPFLDDAAARSLGARLVGLDDLLATSDLVSLHAPALPETRHMVAAPQLAAMMDGAVLVNTARGSLVDHDALTAEVRSGRLGAVLDVTEPEPLPPDHELLHLPGAWVTPHLAGSQGTELSRMADLVLTEIERFAAGSPPLHPVRATDLGVIA